MTRAGSKGGGAIALALLCMSLFIGAGLSEAVLRGYSHFSDSWVAGQLRADPLGVLVEAHGELGYRQKPNGTFRYVNGTAATSNAMGYRGPEVRLTKPAGTIRVVLLGGSTTHGWGVNDGETIDQYMREVLEQRHPGLSFEVINLGFDGYDSYQIFERLKGDGLKLDPDFVIVNTGVNDVRNARFAGLEDRDPRTMLWLSEITRSRQEQLRGGPSIWTRAKHWIYLARLPAVVRAARSQGEAADTLSKPHPDALDYFERNLERILELVRGTSTVVLLSSEPSSLLTKYRPTDTSTISYWIGDAATTQAYRDSLDGRLQSVVQRTSGSDVLVARVPYVQLPPELFLDDAHLTAEGNRRIADAFAGAIEPFLERHD